MASSVFYERLQTASKYKIQPSSQLVGASGQDVRLRGRCAAQEQNKTGGGRVITGVSSGNMARWRARGGGGGGRTILLLALVI